MALGAMAVMLLLGSGGDDILWAFQSGTIGATAAGMAALVVAPRRPAVAALLLTIALSTSGVGLAFFVGTGVHLLLTRPRALPWLLVPLGYYLTWFACSPRRPSRRVSNGLVEYVLAGLTASAAGVLGSTSLVVGSIALLALAFGLGRALDDPAGRLAMLASSVAFFVIAGLVRAQLGPDQATASRYIYVAAPAFLIAGAVLLARIPRPAGTVHRRPRSRGGAGRQRHPAGREPRPAAVEGRLRAGADAAPARQRRQSLLTAGDGADERFSGLDDTSRHTRTILV